MTVPIFTTHRSIRSQQWHSEFALYPTDRSRHHLRLAERSRRRWWNYVNAVFTSSLTCATGVAFKLRRLTRCA
jgi:hypothetical protein